MNKELDTVRTVAALRARIADWRRNGETVALVPTMGGLHDGHLALMRHGLEVCDRVVATIFVNPAQFAPNEDFDTYPRQEAADVAKMNEIGVDLLFAPDVQEMYPPDFSTKVTVAGLTDCLCGVSRPGFFDGVATVVAKLLLQALPDVAIFGEKDYQQLLVVRRMARDLNIPVEIAGAATEREADGLALSSRNAYLNEAQRAQAATLYAALRSAAQSIETGTATPDDAIVVAIEQLKEAGFARIDYLELRDTETLATVTDLERPARLLVAAWLGETRLIDNLAVRP